MNNFKNALSVFLLITLFKSVYQHPAKKQIASKSNDFDYLILALAWPATSCMFPGQHQCQIASQVSGWTIHGLWPTMGETHQPSECHKEMKFDIDTLKPLLPSLEQYWPNLYVETPLDSFWKHEWEKHGTCALSLPEVKNEKDYFNLTLSLRSQYDFGPILKSSSIIPNENAEYTFDSIVNSFKSALNIHPALTCFLPRDSSVQYLSQAQICFSKEFKPINCNDHGKNNLVMFSSAQQEPCKQDLPIRYPTMKH